MDGDIGVEELRELLRAAQQRAKEAEQQRQQAEQRRQQAEQRRQQAEQRRQQAEQRRQQAEQQRQRTTLAEYLDGCHEYLFQNFTVETDKSPIMDGNISVGELRELLQAAQQRAERAERQQQQERQRAEEAEQQQQQERQRAEEAERQQQQERQRAERAEQQRQQELQRAERAEQQRQPTTLAEYLDGCHESLFQNFTVETDKSLTSKGSTTNPQGKRCPTRLLLWADFLEQQKHILGKIHSHYPDTARSFESLDFLRGLGERVARRKVSNEKGLERILHEIVETPVESIVEQLRLLDELRDEFNLGSGIIFENHPNVLSDVADEPRERLRRQWQAPSLHQLRADQICVYRTHNEEGTQRRLAFVVEYKAPHKLTLPQLRTGLREMDIYKEVVNRVTKPATNDEEALFQYHSDRLVAAGVSQTFHYMIEGGLEYSYLTTGEGIVFLKIDWTDPGTLYYHLAEPAEEVQAHPEAFRHCTAVSQVLAFALLALASPTHGQGARQRAVENLNTWEEDVESILHAIPISERKKTPPPSAYLPRTYQQVDRSPYLLRERMKQGRAACRPGFGNTNRDLSPEPPDDEPNMPETPIPQRGRAQLKLTQQTRKRNRSGSSAGVGQSYRYCTQKCLLGLVRGEFLDENCPNVSLHRGDRHQHPGLHPIDHKTWLRLLSEQLNQTLDHDIVPLGKQGARGALFRVTLSAYGYTVVAKGTVVAFVEDLQREAAVYQRLQPLHGVRVPVFLGSADMARPYYYDLHVRIVHMMFLSWAGDQLDSSDIVGAVQRKRRGELLRSVQAIHATGVVHRDIRGPNAFWNGEVGHVFIIDFERSELVDPPRPPLAASSPNRKRKRPDGKDEFGGEKDRLSSERLRQKFLMNADVWAAKSILEG